MAVGCPIVGTGGSFWDEPSGGDIFNVGGGSMGDPTLVSCGDVVPDLFSLTSSSFRNGRKMGRSIFLNPESSAGQLKRGASDLHNRYNLRY